jgi:hypothetical protein
MQQMPPRTESLINNDYGRDGKKNMPWFKVILNSSGKMLETASKENTYL